MSRSSRPMIHHHLSPMFLLPVIGLLAAVAMTSCAPSSAVQAQRPATAATVAVPTSTPRLEPTVPRQLHVLTSSDSTLKVVGVGLDERAIDDWLTADARQDGPALRTILDRRILFVPVGTLCYVLETRPAQWRIRLDSGSEIGRTVWAHASNLKPSP
jgi:hypothetical protein